MERVEVFRVLKLRGLLIWVLLFILFAIITLTVAKRLSLIDVSDPTVDIFLGYSLYGIIMIWILRSIIKLQLDWKGLLGSFPKHYQWWKLIFTVILLLIFSSGTFLLIFYGLSFVIPAFAYSNISEKEYLTASQTAFPLLYNVLNFLHGVVVAPIVEELLFRGIILHRFTVKWNSKYAILISSLLFGMVHFDIIGKGIFGFFMAILYIKSKSLFVPIIAHSVHNGIVSWVKCPNPNVRNVTLSMEQYRSLVWIGIFVLCITAPFVIVFIRKNWPKKDLKLPFFV